MPRALPVQPVLDLEADLAGRVAVTIGVGADGAVAVLGVDGEDVPLVRAAEERGGRVLPCSRTRDPYDALVALRRDGALHHVPLRGLELAHPRVQPLPDGGVLVVGARARVDEDGEGPEANAAVFDGQGCERASFPLGDGIADVQVAADGRIWVSYTDEAVDDLAGLAEVWDDPPGLAGLAAFDPDGAPRLRFAPPAALPEIRDCRALAVGDDAVWALYDPDARLVRITPGGAVEPYACPVAPVTALAVDAERARAVVALGREEEGRALALCAIEDGWLHPSIELEATGPEGEAVTYRAATGRGPLLHLLAGARLLRLDVRDLRR